MNKKDKTIDLLTDHCQLYISMLQEVLLDERVPMDLKVRISQLIRLIGQSNFEFAKINDCMDIYNKSYNEDLK